MTIKNVTTRFTFLALAGALFLASCTSNDSENLPVELTAEEAQNIVLSDDVTAVVEDIVEDDDYDNGTAARGTTTSSAAKCATRTVVENGNEKVVTLDFGDGCIGKRGREYAGKIIITYVKTDTDKSKTVAFDGFTVDGNAVAGGKSIKKVKANTNGNPEATYTVDITITFTTGEVVTKKGTKVREKIEGAATRNRGDDVYSISGNWESVNKEGVMKKATITTNLRREYACRYIVSGVVEIVKDGDTFTLDFGNGECDNKATLTDASGNSKEIILRRK